MTPFLYSAPPVSALPQARPVPSNISSLSISTPLLSSHSQSTATSSLPSPGPERYEFLQKQLKRIENQEPIFLVVSDMLASYGNDNAALGRDFAGLQEYLKDQEDRGLHAQPLTSDSLRQASLILTTHLSVRLSNCLSNHVHSLSKS